MMTTVQYKVGDLFDFCESKGEANAILHVNNDKGGWGSGFVVPLGHHYPGSERQYRKWSQSMHDPSYKGPAFRLGNMLPVTCPARDPNASPVVVCNMVAQAGFGTKRRPRALRYDALASCLQQVVRMIRKHANGLSVNIHCPALGAGLAGGDW